MATISHSKYQIVPSDENETIKQHMGLVVKVAQGFTPINSMVLDEYIQAGRIGLLTAIRKQNNVLSSFSTNAWHSIRWSILDYIKKEKKEQPLPITTDPSGSHQPEDIADYLPDSLSDREREVVILRTEGHTFKDIGEIQGFSKSWANYVFHSGVLKIQQANEGIYE